MLAHAKEVLEYLSSSIVSSFVVGTLYYTPISSMMVYESYLTQGLSS